VPLWLNHHYENIKFDKTITKQAPRLCRLITMFTAVKKSRRTFYISILFLSIFAVKLSIAVAPIFSLFGNKATVNAAIMQLEDSKDDKDNTAKETFKDKKIFEDKDLVLHCYTITPIVTENNILHNMEYALFLQTYHPVVPTPPPNA